MIALDLYAARKIAAFEEYYFSNYEQITLISHGKNKTLFHLAKKDLNGAWNDIWALSLATAKQDLKSSKQGNKYRRTFKVPKYALKRLSKLKEDNIECVGSR